MKEILGKLFLNHSLSRQEAKDVFLNIAKSTYNEYQIASFLTVYKMRNVQVEELLGFRDALLELVIPVDLSAYNAIDLCGTGGDGKNTFNVSTTSAFVVAGAGVKVAKHGNYGVSSICGSSNVLEYLGYQFTNNADDLERQLDKNNICVLHAPLFHPSLKAVGPIRKGFGMSSIFNLLGPMVNPSQPKNQLIGVYHQEVMRLYKYVYQQLDTRHTIVHSIDGYDEISLTGNVRIVRRLTDSIKSPEELGFNKVREADIYGGETVAEAAKIFLSILNNDGTKQQKQVVIANSAMAIQASGMEEDFSTCMAYAQKSIESGAALDCFKKAVG